MRHARLECAGKHRPVRLTETAIKGVDAGVRAMRGQSRPLPHEAQAAAAFNTAASQAFGEFARNRCDLLIAEIATC